MFSRKHDAESERAAKAYMGVDGEGQGRWPHRYVMLMAADESASRVMRAENRTGLATVECLDFLLALPPEAKTFAFSFNYDLTKILADVDDATLWLLFRPDKRKRKEQDKFMGPPPVEWGPYLLNLQGTKFTVARGRRQRVVWDVFKFYQSKFTAALATWHESECPRVSCSYCAMIAAMTKMKDKRGDFDREDPASVRAYCLSECREMASLARRLTEAHEAAGLKLTSYYGAGSSASAMLKGMGILEKLVPTPKEMALQVASAFSGGRFENSRIGVVDGPIWNYDISSAYPYQLYRLPCLEHGKWYRTKSEKVMRRARHALVRWGYTKPIKGPWAPFLYRDGDGAICYPAMSGGGWLWRDEYLAGARLFPQVYMREAFVYECDCSCRPFEKIAHYYNYRLKIGKEGKGIVIKLAVNSCYGKVAQSIGSAPFQSWIWAGMITSGCRAQILEIMALHSDLSNLLMVATDGIFTRERLTTPVPMETGTGASGKPLGGWEEKASKKGMFLARPGVYFPLNPTDDEIKQVRARGIGKSELLRNWKPIVQAWERGERTVEVSEVARFCGAKTSIHRSGGENGVPFIFRRSERYGEWIERRIEMSFDPMPKRASVLDDGSLSMRTMPRNSESAPYDRSLSPEARLLRMAELEALEQPDGGDLNDYTES